MCTVLRGVQTRNGFIYTLVFRTISKSTVAFGDVQATVSKDEFLVFPTSSKLPIDWIEKVRGNDTYLYCDTPKEFSNINRDSFITEERTRTYVDKETGEEKSVKELIVIGLK